MVETVIGGGERDNSRPSVIQGIAVQSDSISRYRHPQTCPTLMDLLNNVNCSYLLLCLLQHYLANSQC